MKGDALLSAALWGASGEMTDIRCGGRLARRGRGREYEYEYEYERRAGSFLLH